MKQTLALAFGAATIVGMMIGAPGLSAAEKVSVCHREGNGGSHVITIGESAVKAHLAHGDHLGSCQPAEAVVPPPAPVYQPPVTPPAPVPPPAPVYQPPVTPPAAVPPPVPPEPIWK